MSGSFDQIEESAILCRSAVNTPRCYNRSRDTIPIVKGLRMHSTIPRLRSGRELRHSMRWCGEMQTAQGKVAPQEFF